MSTYYAFVDEEECGDYSHQLQAASWLPTAQAPLSLINYIYYMCQYDVRAGLHVPLWGHGGHEPTL